MRIIAFETSAKAASCALLEDGVLRAEAYENSGLTHSRTAMRLAEQLLQELELEPSALDAVAWANGPGSFTGVRIGAAAAKGLCWALELPAVPVSTLEAMAWHAGCCEGVVCACMDARRAQVYNALFRCGGAIPERLCPDRAIAVEELASELEALREPVLLVGDGAQLVYEALHARIPALRLFPEHLRQQRAAGVALAAWQAVQEGRLASPAAAAPAYLRLSQAERERLERTEKLIGDR